MAIFLSCLCWIVPCFYQVPQADSWIDWSGDRKLTWEDFRQDPPKNPRAAALTTSEIKVDFDYHNKVFQFHIRCRFNKDASWGAVKNDDVLSHEQGHFDITEIYARRLHAALKKYTPNASTLQSDANAIYQDIMNQYYEREKLYDRETNYSIDHAQQGQWLIRIQSELSATRQDADYH